MKYPIFRTDTADSDLNEIIDYIAKDNCIEVALALLDRIEKAIKKLSDFPYIGIEPKSRTAKRKNYRILIVNNYNIYYKIEIEKIMIHRIRHAKIHKQT